MEEKIWCYFHFIVTVKTFKMVPKSCSYPDEQDLVSEPVASLRQILNGKLLCAVTGRVVLVDTVLQTRRVCSGEMREKFTHLQNGKTTASLQITYERSALNSGPEGVPLAIWLRDSDFFF